MKNPKQYIIVDDDRTNNLICEYAVRAYDPGAVVMSFTDPYLALAHLKRELEAQEQVPRVLFVDVNMPVMSGWEFLAELEKLDKGITEKFSINILSSSTEDFNEEREQFPYVHDFLSKPLSKSALEELQP
ncbi:response regulator [Salinimicrobium tongyeongense]|uniref:Response regulator n=1 Tax=Salinimicrobium tongyeongense TaxID=2809707 RepID=A0ABY6NRN7_9FLAO|nr:response regulator [Salinimicrobium tongyeongense]UZH55316.1 response regulator [Salinimicrobium tongyeongense]